MVERGQSGKTSLLAFCKKPHLIDVCAMGSVALHALRTWPTSDTMNRLGTSHSWLAGIGITGRFMIRTICAHTSKKKTINNNKHDAILHFNTFEFEGKQKTVQLLERSTQTIHELTQAKFPSPQASHSITVFFRNTISSIYMKKYKQINNVLL